MLCAGAFCERARARDEGSWRGHCACRRTARSAAQRPRLRRSAALAHMAVHTASLPEPCGAAPRACAPASRAAPPRARGPSTANDGARARATHCCQPCCALLRSLCACRGLVCVSCVSVLLAFSCVCAWGAAGAIRNRGRGGSESGTGAGAAGRGEEDDARPGARVRRVRGLPGARGVGRAGAGRGGGGGGPPRREAACAAPREVGVGRAGAGGEVERVREAAEVTLLSKHARTAAACVWRAAACARRRGTGTRAHTQAGGTLVDGPAHPLLSRDRRVHGARPPLAAHHWHDEAAPAQKREYYVARHCGHALHTAALAPPVTGARRPPGRPALRLPLPPPPGRLTAGP